MWMRVSREVNSTPPHCPGSLLTWLAGSGEWGRGGIRFLPHVSPASFHLSAIHFIFPKLSTPSKPVQKELYFSWYWRHASGKFVCVRWSPWRDIVHSLNNNWFLALVSDNKWSLDTSPKRRWKKLFSAIPKWINWYIDGAVDFVFRLRLVLFSYLERACILWDIDTHCMLAKPKYHDDTAQWQIGQDS